VELAWMITVEKDGMQFRTKNSILAGINASSALNNAVFIERHGTALPPFELASVFVRLGSHCHLESARGGEAAEKAVN
jgi:hypothetical protein